jgi:hypothetical protein
MKIRNTTISLLKRIILLTVACGFVLGSHTAGAVDVLFYSSNGVYKYNPDDQGSPCGTADAIQPTTTLIEGNSYEERAWNFMIQQGFTEQQVAGMIGNWQIEAPGVDPTTNQAGGGPGRGIAQWTVDERWATLLKWKGDRNEFDLATQLEFVMYELNGTEKSALTDLKATKTIKEATTSFMEKYERPGVPHLDRRITAANTAFGRYSGSVTDKLPPAESVPSQSVVDDACSNPTIGAGGSIIQIALAELAKGVREIPDGCDAGNPSVKGDCGPEVNKYTDSTLEYWCADFVSWVYKEAGTPFTGGSSGGWRIAAVSGVESWFKKNGTWTPNGKNVDPQPGDVITYDFSHVGIVEKVEGETLSVISGNTGIDGSNNGKGVGRDTHENFRSHSQIVGFGSLNK